MQQITITEALAEIKTTLKKVEKKRDFIKQYIAREDQVRDPLEKEGGSALVIERERQAIDDLLSKVIDIRSGIQQQNLNTILTIGRLTMSVSSWLIWKREVAPLVNQNLSGLRALITQARHEAQRRNVSVVSASASINNEAKPRDIVINLSETDLQRDIEQYEQTIGELDGKLSLLNATTMIWVD